MFSRLIPGLLLPIFCCAHTICSPEGEPAPATFVTFYRWVTHLENQSDAANDAIISAAFGKPTAPVDPHVLAAFREYWNTFPDASAIPYGHSAGNWDCRALMANALERQYHHAVNIQSEHLIFTVGGCGALQAAFASIHQRKPNGKLVVISPFYPQYQVLNGGTAQNSLHLVDVTKTGFRLTAAALEESLANISLDEIAAFVFCDPNNPCGTTPGKAEWTKIAVLLERHPHVPIVLDEAYAEMCFKGPHLSLLEVAPQLGPRILLIRSATKGLSAAGERMAVAVVPDKELRNLMLDFITNISLHAPRSHQYAYSTAMQHLDEAKQQELAKFYEQRLAYMQQALKSHGMHVRDPLYQPDSTFYLLADLSVFKGKPLHPEAARILGRPSSNAFIQTDIDIAFHLLMDKQLAIAPLSFFGADPTACLMRITCSDKIEVLQQLMNRLTI